MNFLHKECFINKVGLSLMDSPQALQFTLGVHEGIVVCHLSVIFRNGTFPANHHLSIPSASNGLDKVFTYKLVQTDYLCLASEERKMLNQRIQCGLLDKTMLLVDVITALSSACVKPTSDDLSA